MGAINPSFNRPSQPMYIDNEPRPCLECGQIVALPDMNDHLVEKHQYMRDGQNVYKQHKCACGKKGTYQRGKKFLCRDCVGATTRH